MKTVTKTVKLPLAKPLTLLDLADLIVKGEVDRQDLQKQLNEIAEAVPSRRPLLAVIKNLRACALQSRHAIKEYLELQEQMDAIDNPSLIGLKAALKSLEAHAL